MNINGTRKSINLILNVLDTTKSTIPPIEFPERKKELSSKSADYFVRTSPEECGIESDLIYNYINELRLNSSVGLQSIMIMRNDRVVFESDMGIRSSKLPKQTFSQCKSVIALAIGCLLTQGKLKLTEKINEIFGDRIQPITKMALNGLNIKHLLTMTAGITFNECEAMVTQDWLKGFLNSDISGDFGKKFRYNSLNSYILAAVIKERTGLTVSEYLDSYLFKELGIYNYYWEKCPLGIEKGGWGLYICNEDIAKLGLLVLNNGVWNGKKLIASKYIQNATSPQIEVSQSFGDFNYGYHIWVGRNNDSFLFNGMLGQNLLGFKKSGIMIVANCSNCDLFQQNDFFGITNKYFDRDFPEKLLDNQENLNKLYILKSKMATIDIPNSFLDSFKISRSIEDDLSKIHSRRFAFNGANSNSASFIPLLLQLFQGNYTKGLKEIAFEKNDSALRAIFKENQGEYPIEIGFEQPKENLIDFNGEIYTISVLGEFTQNEDNIPLLKIHCSFLETPYDRCYKFFFDNNEPYAIFSEKPASDLAKNPTKLLSLLGQSRQVIENLLSKFDGDYISIKLEKAFSPKLSMKEIE